MAIRKLASGAITKVVEGAASPFINRVVEPTRPHIGGMALSA
jgi:hypothetical protein